MNYTDEEVQLIVEWNDLSKAFIASKDDREGDPETYSEAKAKMSEFRTKWREIREAFAPDLPDEDDADGTASPTTLSAPATVAEINKATGKTTKEAN